MNRWHTARPQWANCICCCIDGKHGSGWLMNLDGAAEQLNRVEAKAVLAAELLRQAQWFIAWVKDSNITPREAVMSGHAKTWLTAYDALKEQAH